MDLIISLEFSLRLTMFPVYVLKWRGEKCSLEVSRIHNKDSSLEYVIDSGEQIIFVWFFLFLNILLLYLLRFYE